MKKDTHECVSKCYVLYGNLVKKIIAGYFTSNEDIEDIFHDVFLKLVRVDLKGDPFDPAIKHYIVKATRNTCISRIRKEMRHHNNGDSYWLSQIATIEEVNNKDMAETMIDGMVVNTLYDVIKELSNDEQSLLYKKFYQNKKFSEIAAECKSTYYFIDKQLKTIYKKLSLKMVRTCIDHNDIS
ncbi:MAG TPA: sigma-70 family RNA polymerase sigma factor [Spirochaetota bacterium]|jgi:RNA polymerase sigma factor (sigma-70 family)|nr:sigma-70 family RNA polymerase sigma factor [Spirochaetota bacterium]HOF12996.1 sigma-70 family RNA polymerase sigma factor [Spirochaetota bacterium]HOM86828.1 sigma-70 family RNA polymerase sigma factor [Spirochaetota bacterium]HOR92378.1 sigma-70 family RNA polymerase sigma factor [Spirochaetota bacterium]HOT18439.1 sigma-70 family RNA polymerase sigma factor [Spirochaetota bacterium]